MLTSSKKIVAIFMFIIFLGGLFLFAYLGIYNRYWADDWCYNADFSKLGFINTIKGYSYITTYASSRFSLTFFSGVFYYLGILGVQIMTPLNIVLLTVGLYWCLLNIKRIINIPLSNLSVATFTLITIYYSIYLAPHLYQSLYWRSGTLPYFEPIVISTLIFALITHQSIQGRPSTVLNIVTALLAFLAGGFSEAACATLTTSLAIYTGFAWFFRKTSWAKNSLPIATLALAFTLLSMIVLIYSPTTTYRVGIYGEPASFHELPSLIFKYSFGFVKSSFIYLPLPHLAITSTSLLMGYLLYNHDEQQMQTRTTLIIIFFGIGIAFIVIASSFAPSAYIEKVSPHLRTQIIPRFVLTLALVFISWMIGALARQIDQSKKLYGIATLFLLFLAIYSIRSIFIAGKNITIYSERARIWDERDRQIEKAISSGANSIFVTAIDSLPVDGILDFKEKESKGYWVNQCAAKFYNVNSIDITSP